MVVSSAVACLGPRILILTASRFDSSALVQEPLPPLAQQKGSLVFHKIMVPVDLAHAERLDKAIDAAVGLARQEGVPVCVVGVTTEPPSPVAHSPHEFENKLAAYAEQLSQKHQLRIEARAYASHDPSTDLDKTLIAAAKDEGADLIVMASHVPGLPEHLFASHAGAVASHSEASVFVIR